MAKVRDVMTLDKDIPKVSTEASVLDATNVMNAKGTSAVAVVDPKSRGVVGFFGERTLLTEFVRLDKRPDEVRVGEIMHALYKIDPDATTREAAKEIVDTETTRLGVYDGGRFMGWVTLVDLSRHFSRETLIERLRSHNAPESAEVRCPNCHKAFLEKVSDREGRIVRWQCPNCGYSL